MIDPMLNSMHLAFLLVIMNNHSINTILLSPLLSSRSTSCKPKLPTLTKTNNGIDLVFYLASISRTIDDKAIASTPIFPLFMITMPFIFTRSSMNTSFRMSDWSVHAI
jgi:hypothetical protein